MKTNAITSQSYDNEFRWKYVLVLLGFDAIYVANTGILFLLIDCFFYVFGNVPLLDNVIRDMWLLLSLAVLFFGIFALKYFQRFRTGKYSIVGDNLIVHEQYFSSTTDLTIPISNITGIQFTPRFRGWNAIWKSDLHTPAWSPYRFIDIKVGKQTYVLYSFAHAEELYNELCMRIRKDNTNL